MMTTNMTTRDLIAALAPVEVARGGALAPPWRGKSATKQVATALGSRCACGLSGNDEIKVVILPAAASLGIRAKAAAYCHGSTSSRANAERTVSSIPFFSSPMGANRKSSNSDSRRESEAEPVISVTEFRHHRRTDYCQLLGLDRRRHVRRDQTILHAALQNHT